jgi:hypothetical protein
MSRTFWVADLNARGELQSKADYRYDQLEQITEAAELIIQFSTILWRNPEGFETSLSPPFGHLWIRWRPVAPTAGIATMKCRGELTALSLLATGKDADADQITLDSFQRHLLRELHDTGFEPAFGLVGLTERPLVATINFAPPTEAADKLLIALADRCFAASYFRCHDLA